MQLSTFVVEKHTKVGIVMVDRFLHLDDALDILKLGFRSNSIFTRATTQATKDVPCFLFSVGFDEPSGRLGAEPDDGEEDKQEY